MESGRLAQLVEQLTLNQWVRGSNPLTPAINSDLCSKNCWFLMIVVLYNC